MSTSLPSMLGSVLMAFASSALVGDEVAVADLVTIDREPLDRSLNGGVVSYAEALREARPTVVSVYSKAADTEGRLEERLLEEFFGFGDGPRLLPQLGLGSGVIVTENGYILTNNHVVSFADEIKVQLDNQRIYDAELVGTDPGTDIAIIKIEETGLPRARMADSDLIEIGDVVFAIGNPLGVGKTVTMGIVSATERQQMGVIDGGFEDFIQTDASINTGNSGGALVDATGRLIGINTLIQTDGASSGNIGIGFAVPINLAYSVMVDLVERGSVARGFLGVGIERFDQEKAESLGLESLQGALVNQVNAGTPAEEAGVREGDVIVEVDGEPVQSPSDLRITIAGKKPGEEVEIVLVRDKERRALRAVLADRSEVAMLAGENREEAIPPSSPPTEEEPSAEENPPVEEPVEEESSPSGFLEGVVVESLNDERRAKFEIDESVEGVVITQVAADSPHADTLPVGMVIQKVNGKNVSTEAEAAANLKRSGRNMLLVTYRGVYRWVAVEVE